MKTPTAAEIEKLLPRGFKNLKRTEQTLDLSITEIEEYTGEFLTRRHVAELLFLTDRAHALRHFPIHDLQIQGMRETSYTQDTGIIYPYLAPAQYEVIYEVGPEEGDLSALAHSATINLVLYRITLDFDKYFVPCSEEIEVMKQNHGARKAERQAELKNSSALL